MIFHPVSHLLNFKKKEENFIANKKSKKTEIIETPTDFDIILKSESEDGTVIMTSSDRSDITDKLYDIALSFYDPKNKLYSAYLNESSTSSSTLTQSEIESLGTGAQSNISSIRTINGYIRDFVNTDDLIGMVVQSLSNNINTDMRLIFPETDYDLELDEAIIKQTKALISDFNEQVDIESFIYNSILISYLEGNYVSMLRNKKENWQIDYLPLHLVENSGFDVNGNPVMLMNITELSSALSKTRVKTKKGTFLFFKDVAEEIKNSFSAEVYKAYTAKDNYAKLDPQYTGMVRINNFARKYGISPIFRALSATLVLQTYQDTDIITAKAKSKKIIHQSLRKELMGQEGLNSATPQMAFAHKQLMDAWSNKTVITTTPPYVESIQYVEPKTDDVDVEKVNMYRNKVLSSLGVAFLAADKSQTAATANINLSQLLKCINSISRQTEKIIERYYRRVLEANNIDIAYTPKVKIIDAEYLDEAMKLELATLLYTVFGCSRETAFGIVGINAANEKKQRIIEAEDGYNEAFTPYVTSYTTSGGDIDETGRPADSEDTDKQAYDQQYNQTRT